MAINRDVIGPDVLGSGELPAYGWVPPGTANYDGVEPYQPEWVEATYEERVSTAKEIMAGLGYTAENPLTLQLKYNTNDNHQRVAVAIQSMWSRDRRQCRALQLGNRGALRLAPCRRLRCRPCRLAARLLRSVQRARSARGPA